MFKYICTLIPICLQTVWYLSLNDTAFEEYSFSFLVHSWNISHKLLSTHEPCTKMYYKKYLNNHPMSNTQYSTDQHQVFGDTINFSWTKMLSSWSLQSCWKPIFFSLDYPSLKKIISSSPTSSLCFLFLLYIIFFFLQDSIRKVVNVSILAIKSSPWVLNNHLPL